jgi:hypothetical protein
MVQLESDKQVLLLAFFSPAHPLKLQASVLTCKSAGLYISSLDVSPDGKKTFIAKLESFQCETHLIVWWSQ